ncbi:MAG: thiamine-phosphate kinase [Thermoplasmata archaeon]|nr:thiamine-phosphate kinase [Thermoplasmata archaeon]MCI4356530.1 thiamine-phosphate kinase [Thermoplasmata archaeon]
MFSERGFHARLRAAGRPSAEIPLPIGDDAAAVRISAGKVALLTTDALVEGTHFLSDSAPADVGRSAVGVSLSDVAAKGGRPIALLLDLLLPPQTPPSWADAVAAGARAEIRQWGGELVGGDTKPSATRSVVGTVLAEGDPRHLVPRSGARAGDVLVTTGTVGRGGILAAALHRGRPTPSLRRQLLRVEPRLFEGRVLVRFAHAMLDTSDGLGESARLLSEASRVRIEVDFDRLPLAPGLRAIPAGAARDSAVFYGGDYELLAAVPAARVAAAIRAVRRVGGLVSVVGEVKRGKGAYLRRNRELRPMPGAGWRPFETALARVGPSQPLG